MALPPVKSIDINKCETQNYIIKDSQKIIHKPTPGCLLLRSKKPFGSNDIFVVVRVGYKKRGNNKGVTDTVMLDKIIEKYSSNVTYEPTTHPLILSLTNHGDWWSKTLTNQYVFEWDPHIGAVEDGVEDGVEDKSNTQIKSITPSIPIPVSAIPIPIQSSLQLSLQSSNLQPPHQSDVSVSNSWDETNRLSPMKISNDVKTSTPVNQRRWTLQYPSNISADSQHLNTPHPFIVIQDNPA